MRPEEIDVKAKSVYSKDHFELRLDRETGRMQVSHKAPRSNRGALVAVYATARDSKGPLEVDVMTRQYFEPLFHARSLDDRALAAAEQRHLAHDVAGADRRDLLALVEHPRLALREHEAGVGGNALLDEGPARR